MPRTTSLCGAKTMPKPCQTEDSILFLKRSLPRHSNPKPPTTTHPEA